MPTRVFSQLDAIAGVFTVGAGSFTRDGAFPGTDIALSFTLLETGIGSYSMDLNLASIEPDDTASCEVGADLVFGGVALIQTWTVDYNNFPSIPDGARIKKLTFRRPRSVNYVFDTNDVSNAMQLLFYADALITPIYFTSVNESPFTQPKTVNEIFAGVDADEVLFDHTAGATFVTKDDLIALWSNFNNNLYGISNYSTRPVDGNPCTAHLAGSLTFGLGWTVTVQYDEVYQWGIPQPDIPIDVGSVVDLVSPTVDAPELAVDFEDVTAIDILIPDYTVPDTFITVSVPIGTWSLITARTLSFVMPSWGGRFPTVIKIRLTSTQFTGTVELKMATIYFASASGIYELVPGKTSDTLYIEKEPGETIDVKIPNPFGRTGFF